MKPTVYIVHHFFHPDTGIGTDHMKELALGLVGFGWDVTVLTSNRFFLSPKQRIEELDEDWEGIHIIRIPRRPRSQSSGIGRFSNALVMQYGWINRLETMSIPDVLIAGTDPCISQLMFPILRRLMPDTKLVFWAFALYPEMLEAMENPLLTVLSRSLRPLSKRACRPLDLLVDIGPCMQKRLAGRARDAQRETVTPWTLPHPGRPVPPPAVREELFGSARLGVLHPDASGREQTLDRFVRLSRRLREMEASVAFCFLGQGNHFAQYRKMKDRDDDNIRFIEHPNGVPAECIQAADLCMIGLKPGWAGTMIPPAFSDALAAGKPVLYDGPTESDIGLWIGEHNLGMILSDDHLEEAAQQLAGFSVSRDGLPAWQEKIFRTSERYFSREQMLSRWDRAMRSLIENR